METELIKLSLDRANKLHENLTRISVRAGINGYLTGMLQDVARCITANMSTDPDRDSGDKAALSDMLGHLEQVEMTLSQYMNTAIVRSE